MQKRIVAIHDISCLGKCSLTVALPVLSVAGFETCCVPTAVLSTHTGGFTNYTYRDLTNDLLPIAKHWKTLNYHYDAFYTGFLGSIDQIEIVKEMYEMLKDDNTLLFVDPVMADNGQLYAIFDPKFPNQMYKLCQVADVILPNMTEACLLLNKPYNPGPYTKEYIEEMLKELAQIAPTVILTGVYYDDTNYGTAYYNSLTNEMGYKYTTRVNAMSHGTGDIFSSAFIGAYLNEIEIGEAVQIACNYTSACIQHSLDEHSPFKYAVNFEAELGNYFKMLHKI